MQDYRHLWKKHSVGSKLPQKYKNHRLSVSFHVSQWKTPGQQSLLVLLVCRVRLFWERSNKRMKDHKQIVGVTHVPFDTNAIILFYRGGNARSRFIWIKTIKQSTTSKTSKRNSYLERIPGTVDQLLNAQHRTERNIEALVRFKRWLNTKHLE